MDYGEPDAIPASEFPIILKRLDYLVDNLPDEIPIVSTSDSAYGLFVGDFTLDQEILEKTGCEVATLGEQLEYIFGHKARTTGDGVAEIKERGPAVPAMVEFLRKYFSRNQDNNTDLSDKGPRSSTSKSIPSLATNENPWSW